MKRRGCHCLLKPQHYSDNAVTVGWPWFGLALRVGADLAVPPCCVFSFGHGAVLAGKPWASVFSDLHHFW